MQAMGRVIRTCHGPAAGPMENSARGKGSLCQRKGDDMIRNNKSVRKMGGIGEMTGCRISGRKVKKQAAGLALGLSLTLSLVPLTSFAGSPEFAYSAEKWATLRDNKLEYGEIADLIHEYNNTVIQNQIDYRDYKDDDVSDIAQEYYDAADEIYNRADISDPESSDYASSLYSYLNNRKQAETLREQGDDNVDDGEIKKLQYDQTEYGLVKQAQQLMISYWSQIYGLEAQKVSRDQAEISYNQTVTRQQAGMATQSQVLSAKQSVTDADASILSAQSSLDKTKEQLCLMLGWTYGAEVEICEVPEPDLEAISAIDLEADVAAGLEQNYALRITAKRLDNARGGTVRESLEENYKLQKETVATNIKSTWQMLILAKSDYEQALNAYELEQKDMAAAERKLAAGVITPNDYQTEKSAFTTAELNVRTKKLALLTAYSNYTWAVAGLASAT